MRTLFKPLLAGLLLVLVVALGFRLTARHQVPQLATGTAPVVVRKASDLPLVPKSVLPRRNTVRPQRPVPTRPRKLPAS
ncbi:MAG: hypothetical protein M3Y54_19595 [Bacteroidota bacterium]|nr:hypothetical protein [Bacteroidota bacterium]